jgi:cellulose synthase (UDP-forming)
MVWRNLAILNQRRLVEMLFCRPGQWQSRRAPGEWRSLWLLLRILLQPKFIFDRRPSIRVVAVNKG